MVVACERDDRRSGRRSAVAVVVVVLLLLLRVERRIITTIFYTLPNKNAKLNKHSLSLSPCSFHPLYHPPKLSSRDAFPAPIRGGRAACLASYPPDAALVHMRGLADWKVWLSHRYDGHVLMTIGLNNVFSKKHHETMSPLSNTRFPSAYPGLSDFASVSHFRLANRCKKALISRKSSS